MEDCYFLEWIHDSLSISTHGPTKCFVVQVFAVGLWAPLPRKGCVGVRPCAEWAMHCSLAQSLCTALHLPLGPETHQSLAELDCPWIVLFEELEVEGSKARQKGSPADRALALCTFRRLLLLWMLTHPFDKLLSISFLAFCLSCLFILFQIRIISQHPFSWHTASSTLSAIKVSLLHHKPAQSACC